MGLGLGFFRATTQCRVGPQIHLEGLFSSSRTHSWNGHPQQLSESPALSSPPQSNGCERRKAGVRAPGTACAHLNPVCVSGGLGEVCTADKRWTVVASGVCQHMSWTCIPPNPLTVWLQVQVDTRVVGEIARQKWSHYHCVRRCVWGAGHCHSLWTPSLPSAAAPPLRRSSHGISSPTSSQVTDSSLAKGTSNSFKSSVSSRGKAGQTQVPSCPC